MLIPRQKQGRTILSRRPGRAGGILLCLAGLPFAVLGARAVLRPSAALAAPVAAPRQAAADPGKDTYDVKCSGCHDNGANGPDLHGLFQKEKLKDGRPVNDDTVRDTIAKGGDDMPPFADQLSKDEIDTLIKYLHTLK